MAVSDETKHIAYWTALGRFIHHFAEMELAIKAMLSQVVGTRKGMIQAIWSGTRADAAMSLIGRVYEADGNQPHRFYTRACEQFGNLNSLRNIVAHLPVDDKSGAAVVSNFSKMLPGKHVEYPATADFLIDAAHDAQTIWMAMWLAVLEAEEGIESPTKWEKRALAPWRYKSPAQTDGGRPQDKRGRSQPSRRRSLPQ